MEIPIEELFMMALGNSRIETEIVGDLTSFSKADSRNKGQKYKNAGKKYCDNNFDINKFGLEIRDIIQKMTDITRQYPELTNLTNFTLVPGIYEEGITDNNFPKIRKDVLEKLNEHFFKHQSSTIQILTKISTEKGIKLLNNSFIRKKKGETGGSEIVMEDKFYREKLNYFKMSGKPDLNKRLNSFKEGIKGVLESITANSNKNYFFASHSHFMQALYKSICESGKTPYFDNLDILHLIVLPDNILVKGIYRWKYSYKLDIHSFLGDCKSDSTKDLKEPYLNLFMMRHCVACHNVVESLLKKGLKKMKKNYGSTSMCLKLVEDLNEEVEGSRKIMGLIKMLKENTGTDKLIESINFGSSVSLRTTLTGLVVQRLIALNTTPGEPLPPSTESKSSLKPNGYDDEDMEEIRDNITKIITSPDDNLKDKLNNVAYSPNFSEDQRFEIIKLLNKEIKDNTTKQPYIDTFIFYKQYLYLNEEIDFTTFLDEKEKYNEGIHNGRKKFIGRMYPTTSSGESVEVSKKSDVKQLLQQELKQEKGANARKKKEAEKYAKESKRQEKADKKLAKKENKKSSQKTASQAAIDDDRPGWAAPLYAQARK